jgi:hypothetical protein
VARQASCSAVFRTAPRGLIFQVRVGAVMCSNCFKEELCFLGLIDFAQDPLLAHGNIFSAAKPCLLWVICCNVVLTLSVVAAHPSSAIFLVYLACLSLGIPPMSPLIQRPDWSGLERHLFQLRQVQASKTEARSTTHDILHAVRVGMA